MRVSAIKSSWQNAAKTFMVFANYRKHRSRVDTQNATPESSSHAISLIRRAGLPRVHGILLSLSAGVLATALVFELVGGAIDHRGEISLLASFRLGADEVFLEEWIAHGPEPGCPLPNASGIAALVE